jgi:hypothetical protein
MTLRDHLRSARNATYDLFENIRQAPLRRQLGEDAQLARFEQLAPRYEEAYRRLTAAWPVASTRDNALYDWSSWAGQVRKAFTERVPADFLNHPRLVATMVLGRRHGAQQANDRLPLIVDAFDAATARSLLRDDPIGSPNIVSREFLASACRVAHVYGLAQYQKTIGSPFWSASNIVEWGGGFGTMARLIQRMNPDVTYTILDLPEILSLQYVYLASILGMDRVNLVEDRGGVAAEKINFLPSAAVTSGAIEVTAEGFLSTWALNESPVEAQQFVLDRAMFGAKRILIAYADNEGNAILRHPLFGRLTRVRAAALAPGSEYAFL